MIMINNLFILINFVINFNFKTNKILFKAFKTYCIISKSSFIIRFSICKCKDKQFRSKSKLFYKLQK